MSATIIPLVRRSKPPLTNIRSDAVEEVLSADPADPFFEGSRVRLLLEGLRAQQDTLLSIIDRLRAPSLQAHPNFSRPAADLEATSGLPPEKWSSLRYGFEPCGGYFYGTEEAYG